MNRPTLRRIVNNVSLAAQLAMATVTCGLVQGQSVIANGAEKLTIEIRETAGINRRSYPVHVDLRLARPPVDATRFRLLDDAGPVVAQFQIDPSRPGMRHCRLDFQSHLKPFESRRYVVEYGPDVTAGPQRSTGHRLTETDTAWKVTNAPYITWTIPKRLGRVLDSVHFRPLEHIRKEAGDSCGLRIIDRDGNSHPLSPPSRDSGNVVTGRSVTMGPLAVQLRFEVAASNPSLRGVRSVVDLHFPVSRSWVEVDWRLVDPNHRTQGVQAIWNLNLDPPTSKSPTLADFGAGSLVYTSLRPGQVAELRGTPPSKQTPTTSTPKPRWTTWRGKPKHLELLVSGPRNSTAGAEGWAHLMDRKRCLALAVGRFSSTNIDRIRLSAEGRAELDRRWAKPAVAEQAGKATNRRLRFWLHFVHFPPQHSAATSPQAMQNPIEARVIGSESSR